MGVKECFIDLLSYRNKKLCKSIYSARNFSLSSIGMFSILKPISDFCNSVDFLGKHYCLTFITLIATFCCIIVMAFITTFILFFIIDKEILFK